MNTITAIMASNAEARVCLGGAWTLWMNLQQPRMAMPMLAIKHYGHGEAAAQAAHSAANRLQRGCRVSLWCEGLDIDHTPAGRQAIVLRGVDAIHIAAHSNTSNVEAL